MCDECLDKDAGSGGRDVKFAMMSVHRLSDSDWSLQVYTITDRGPNQDCGDMSDATSGRNPKPTVDSGKGFPLERFSPTVTEVSLTKDVS